MFQDAPVDLRHISLIYISFSADHSLKIWLRKLRTIALPVYFTVSNIVYGIQLSITYLNIALCV